LTITSKIEKLELTPIIEFIIETYSSTLTTLLKIQNSKIVAKTIDHFEDIDKQKALKQNFFCLIESRIANITAACITRTAKTLTYPLWTRKIKAFQKTRKINKYVKR
tara:strand:+ start:463 stop:783 length:321 start_codon:yes stop_codon:yes gene_type:complete